jgi:ATP-binding cassette subfamily B multidrug efflux pump
MLRLLKYIWNYKILVIVPSGAMFASLVLDMFNPYISKDIVDKVIVNGETNILPRLLILLLVITLVRTVLGYIKEVVSDYLATKISKELKFELYNHIQTLPYSYFDKANTGELLSRISEDVDNVWKTIAFGFRLLIEQAGYFIIATAILLYLNWKLAVVCTIVVLPIALIAVKLEKEVGVIFDKISDQTALMNMTAQENISGVRLVKAFAREKFEILKFLKLNKSYYKLNMEQTNIFAKYFPLIEFLTNLTTIVLVCFGGYLVIKTGMSYGTLVAFVMYSGMLIWPMRLLGWLTSIMAQNKASAEKIFAILDTKPEIKDPADPVHPEKIKGEITFNNVSLKYDNENVLHNISLTVKPGETTAIMGTTGSGKTSIVNLIGRYYDVNEGSVLVDGCDVRKLSLHDLRSKMAVVSQDTFLFSETIEENVRLGNFQATMEDIKKACDYACASEFISELPEGYSTIIGERGIGLSGGQKQRLSIARALVREARILILDDSTSALDMETEFRLLKNLKNLHIKPTTFIIAHRISAVKNADQIIFIEDGRIVEKGTHNELLTLKGRYYDIYREQFKDFASLESEVV